MRRAPARSRQRVNDIRIGQERLLLAADEAEQMRLVAEIAAEFGAILECQIAAGAGGSGTQQTQSESAA